MGYIVIDNFSGGLDDRKSKLTAAAGTLTRCNNAHLTAGGEIEKRKGLFPIYTFPTATYCIGGRPGVGKTVHLYGNGPKPPNMPWVFDWIDVTLAGYGNATRIVNVDNWGGDPYALIEYENGYRVLWLGKVSYPLNNPSYWGFAGDGRLVSSMLVTAQKSFLVKDSVLYASGVAEPTKFGLDGLVGTAVYDVSHYGPKAFTLAAMSVYQNRLVTYSDAATMIWDVDPDPDLTAPVQFLDNFGTVAGRSVLAYGEVDTFVLSQSGVRSIRARDSSGMATVNDIGSPINRTLTRNMQTGKLYVPNAIGCYEPQDGRYWLSIADTIYVLSYFPSSRVTAWSTYSPGFIVQDMFAVDSTVLVLGEGVLYSYGAYNPGRTPSGGIKVPYSMNEYDSTVAEIELPFVDAEKPASRKHWTGVDAALEGRWDVTAGFDINRANAEDAIARLTQSTYDDMAHPVAGESTHLKLRLQTVGSGYARLSNMAIHFTMLGAD